jgi:hypothetical protein
MSSAINPNSIDNQYPVAGQDNNSQGFRDNFTAIKNNLDHAKSEISDLQNKALLKAPLAGETTVSNSLAGISFSGAVLVDTRQTTRDLGTLAASTSQTINNSLASFQRIALGGSPTSYNSSIAFTNFPTVGQWAKLTLEITVSNVAHTLVLPAVTLVNTENLTGYYAPTRTLTFPANGVYVYEFSTYNAGSTLFVNELSRRGAHEAATLTGISTAETLVVDALSTSVSGSFTLANAIPTSNVGATGDEAGMVAVDASYIFVCTAAYDGMSVIWKRAALSVWP